MDNQRVQACLHDLLESTDDPCMQQGAFLMLTVLELPTPGRRMFALVLADLRYLLLQIVSSPER